MDNRKLFFGASASPPSPPGSPSSGYSFAGNPSIGQAASIEGAWWFHAIGEEIRNVITAGGLTPDINATNQLLGAINVLIAALEAKAITKTTPFGTPGGSLVYTPTKNRIWVDGVGAGGGGGGGLATDFSGAGGSSGEGNLWREFTCVSGVPLTFYCGVGGAGGAVGVDGSDGENSTITGLPGGTYTLLGGKGGKHGDSVLGYCAGGAPVGGMTADAGGQGGYAMGAKPGEGGGSVLSSVTLAVIGATTAYIRGAGGPGGYINEAGHKGGDGYWFIHE